MTNIHRQTHTQTNKHTRWKHYHFAIADDNELYRLKMKGDTPEYCTKCKQYRNKFHDLVNSTEREYYDHFFHKNKTNLTQSWKIIKDIICKKKTSSTSCSRFYISNKCTANKQCVADGFNSCFANIGPSLADRIPASTASIALNWWKSYISSRTQFVDKWRSAPKYVSYYGWGSTGPGGGGGGVVGGSRLGFG